jgi:hypothetical protein
MLLLLPAIVAFLGVNVWILATSLRNGAYRLRGGGRPGSAAPPVPIIVSRDDRPGAFWLLAGFNVCVVLVVAYVVYVAAGLTYESWLAGQWN